MKDLKISRLWHKDTTFHFQHFGHRSMVTIKQLQNDNKALFSLKLNFHQQFSGFLIKIDKQQIVQCSASEASMMHLANLYA